MEREVEQKIGIAWTKMGSSALGKEGLPQVQATVQQWCRMRHGKITWETRPFMNLIKQLSFSQGIPPVVPWAASLQRWSCTWWPLIAAGLLYIRKHKCPCEFTDSSTKCTQDQIGKGTYGLPFHMVFNRKDQWIVTSHKCIVSNGFKDILHAQYMKRTVFMMS